MSDDRFEKDSAVFKPATDAQLKAADEREWVTMKAWLIAEFEAGREQSKPVKDMAQVLGVKKLIDIYREWKKGEK